MILRHVQQEGSTICRKVEARHMTDTKKKTRMPTVG